MVSITETFENLDYEKRKRILNAALKEFADNGYDRASTNQIVKNAGIGKGMLFYYFKNKRELYYYLANYSMDITIKDYFAKFNENEPDFIERLKQSSKIKMHFFAEHPNVFQFLGTFFLIADDQLPEDLKEKYHKLTEIGYKKLYQDIDYSLFREGIDVEKAFQLIQWAIEGYQQDLKKRLQGKVFSTIDLKPYWDEFYEYLDVLKKSFYK